MKKRIFKMSESQVAYQDYSPEIDFIPKGFENFPYIICDETEIPVSDSNTGDYHEMIYFDGDCKLENLKQDKSWQCQLMPLFLIKQKQENFLNTSLDIEISKENPNVNEVAKMWRDKEKLKNKDELELYQMALENLSRAEIDKPVIRGKLQLKIKELSE